MLDSIGRDAACRGLLDARRDLSLRVRTGTRGEMATMISIDLPLDDLQAPPTLRLVKA